VQISGPRSQAIRERVAESESNHPPLRPPGGLLFGFAHGHAWLKGARGVRGAWHGSHGIFIAQTNIHYAIWHV